MEVNFYSRPRVKYGNDVWLYDVSDVLSSNKCEEVLKY